MKKTLLFCSWVLFVSTVCFAQSNQTESLTITTYYPAPYGVYRNLKLNPSQEPTTGVSAGVMYYDNSTHTLRYHNDYGWVNVTESDNNQTASLQALGGANPSCPSGNETLMKCVAGGQCYDGDNSAITSWNKVLCGSLVGADGSALLIGKFHTALECSKSNGNPVQVPGGSICKFISASCPSSWAPYGLWRTVPAQSKSLGGSCTLPHTCRQLGSGTYVSWTGSCSCSASIPASGWSNSQGTAGSCSCTATGTCYLQPMSCPVGPLSIYGTPSEVACQ
jgi:hypothetical protein